MVKEAKVLEYFGPERSLLVHLAPLWKAAIDIICGNLCRSLHEPYPNKWGNVATALTHPEILRRNRSNRNRFKAAIGFQFVFHLWCSVESEIKNYLRDRERAGRYFVDSGMYATLCLHFGWRVPHTPTRRRHFGVCNWNSSFRGRITSQISPYMPTPCSVRILEKERTNCIGK
jgi:hypothetical protein